MFAVFLNCLYAGGNLKKPYFLYHFNNFKKYLSGQEKTPVIAQQNCFDKADIEGFKGLIPYIIPQELEDSYINKHPSEKEAWKALLNEAQKEYVEWIGQCLDKIQRDSSEKIEGVLTYVHCPSLHTACNEYGIPVIEFDMSPIRYPIYNCSLGYFLRTNKYSTEESSQRYANFLRELSCSNNRLLSRKEIMSIVLLPEDMYLLYNYNSEAEYDLGIALSPEDDSYREVWAQISNSDIISKAENVYENSILLRAHPTEIEHFEKYNIDIDTSNNSLAFISKCERVATICSNVGFESILLGKPTYILGNLPFSDGAMKSLDTDDDMVCDMKYVNFIAFCLCVPFELMHDINYIRWRLTNPSETEIYKKSLEYIFQNILKINEDILNCRERLNKILIGRGLMPYHYNKKITNLDSDYPWFKRQLSKRDKEIFDLELQLAKLRYTK